MNLLACSILLIASPVCGSATAQPYAYLGLTPRVVAVVPQSSSDAILAAARRQDREARNARGIITRLTPEEHLRRASIYHSNRAFDEAREHW